MSFMPKQQGQMMLVIHYQLVGVDIEQHWLAVIEQALRTTSSQSSSVAAAAVYKIDNTAQ